MIGQNFCTIRSAWKLGQQEMADLLQIKKGRYQAYEVNRNEPDLEVMCRLEDLTGIPIKRLFRHAIMLKEIPDKPLTEDNEIRTENTAREPSPIYGEIQLIKRNLEELEKRVLATY